ncbi:peptidylprolyl isomerase [Chryseotalea sanaruensis]|nr:peptidylprolyl isomerase [Chryseotalea sanaruensis]
MRLVLRLLCLSLLINFSGQAQSKEKPVTIFSVNKKSVGAEEFIYLYQKNHKGREGEFNKEKIEEYLDLYIKFKLKVEEARQRGMDTTTKFTKEYLGYKEALRKPYLPDNKLIDSLTQLTYNRMLEEVKAAHILIKVNPDAAPEDTLQAYNKILNIRKRLDAGEDFGTLAMTFSEDPSAKSNEGNLGYFTAFQMVYPFEAAAYSTAIGSVSNPVRTRFGYHLVKVDDKRKAQGEIEVSHLLIRVGKDRNTEKARLQIFDIYDRLQGGMPWGDLCKQYSEDQSTKDNGGKLRPFGVGAMASVPEFEGNAFGLINPGDYSAPFETQYGWHIVKLERKIPVPAYNELESSLKSRVSRDERMQVAKEAIAVHLRKKYAFKENAEVKRKAMLLADSTLQKGAWRAPNENLNTQTLFTLESKAVPVEKFFAYVSTNQKPNKLTPVLYFNQLYESFVNNSIEMVVEETLMSTNADYRFLSNEYYEGILLFDIMEKEVWNKASTDTIGQRSYFENNSAKYNASERAQATIYSAAKKEPLDGLETLLTADSIIENAYLKKNGIRMDQGRYEKNERAVLDKVNWAPGHQKIELDGIYYLVKIDSILPAGSRTFEEARGLLVADYQTYLENKWLETLRKKYPVKINAKGKKYVLGKLTKAG